MVQTSSGAGIHRAHVGTGTRTGSPGPGSTPCWPATGPRAFGPRSRRPKTPPGAISSQATARFRPASVVTAGSDIHPSTGGGPMAATFMVIGAATWPLLAAALVLALLGVLRTRTADARSVQGILAFSLLIYTCVLLPPIGDMAGWPRQLTGGFALLGFLTAIPSAVMLLRYFRRYVRSGGQIRRSGGLAAEQLATRTANAGPMAGAIEGRPPRSRVHADRCTGCGRDPWRWPRPGPLAGTVSFRETRLLRRRYGRPAAGRRAAARRTARREHRR